MIQLLHGDCLEKLKELPDHSVDMVLTDPPYACLNKGNQSAAWDKSFDLDAWWPQILRVAKENTAIILFSQGLFSAKMMLSQPNLYRYSLVWNKVRVTGFLNAKRMPMRQHEDILVFYRKLPVFNPQMSACPPHKRNHDRGSLNGPLVNHCYGKFEPTPAEISDEKYPTSILTFSKGFNKEAWLHPTSKPVNLLSYLIETYSDRGGIILDTFMGSGSTGVACLNTDRSFIGIELDPKFFNIAEDRINKVKREPRLI